jgi:cyclase
MKFAFAWWLILTVLAGVTVHAQPVVRTADPVKRGLHASDFPRAIKVAPNVYAFEDIREIGGETFPTTNLFVVTSEGVLLADAQIDPAATKRLVDTIAKITPQPIKYVVICSEHGDHTGGNISLPAGVTYIVHPTAKAAFDRRAAAPNAPAGAWKLPADAETVSDKKVIRMGGEEIQILFLGRAHTGSDLTVYLPKEKIFFLSETYMNRVFPPMRTAYPSEWLAAVEKAEKMKARVHIPGHGFTEAPKISVEELHTFHNALQAVIDESTRLAQGRRRHRGRGQAGELRTVCYLDRCEGAGPICGAESVRRIGRQIEVIRWRS